MDRRFIQIYGCQSCSHFVDERYECENLRIFENCDPATNPFYYCPFFHGRRKKLKY